MDIDLLIKEVSFAPDKIGTSSLALADGWNYKLKPSIAHAGADL